MSSRIRLYSEDGFFVNVDAGLERKKYSIQLSTKATSEYNLVGICKTYISYLYVRQNENNDKI